MRSGKLFIAGLFAVLLIAGCGPKGAAPLSVEDTPPNHYLRGMELVDEGKVSEAEARFARALELDPKYAPGFAGMGLVAALSVQAQPDAGHRKVEVEKFRKLLDTAESRAKTSEDKFVVAVTAIRAETAAKDGKWIKAADKWYGKGYVIKKIDEGSLPYYRNAEALDYFMGKAWFEAGEYAKAKELLGNVVGKDVGKWHRKANALYARAQKIERAMANYTVTDVSKAIAAKERVSRADVAALMDSELNLDKLFAGRLSAKPVPEASFVPADIVDNPFKAEILDVLKWNIRGLEPVYDPASKAELFKPAEPVTRKEMALALEDVLIKVSGDESLANKYFGQESSPYADVKPTQACYNAVVNAVSRNLMETDLSGAFRPDADLDGAELLLAVVRLRNAVNVY